MVASFNGERFLRAALESLFAQDFDSYEAVFVDDGSSDSTAEIARTFAVRYLYQTNQGLAAARNAGIAASRGEFVTFLDDDDVLPRTKLRSQATYLLDHPETGCVLGRQEWMTEDGAAPVSLRRDPVFDDPGGIPMASMMVRRAALDAVGGFDPTFDYAEDRDLLVRLREHGVGIAVLPEVVLHRRLHDSNMILSPPEHHPLLRSLREKMERERSKGRE